jgi:hypothetical protein
MSIVPQENGKLGLFGVVNILNVAHGDTEISFKGDDPEEVERSKLIITDMLRRGYTIMIEVQDEGIFHMKRVLDFDPKTTSYIVAAPPPADFVPETESSSDVAPRKRKQNRRHVPAKDTRGVAIGRSAGG